MIKRNSLLTLIIMIVLGVGILAVPVLLRPPQPAAQRKELKKFNPGDLKEAMFYEKLPGQEVECQLCPRRCLLRKGEIGDCQVRANIKGTVYSLVYGKPCSLSLEPIEKAPFYHFLPGHTRLCIATVGCNLRCKYCQNREIFQKSVEEVEHLNLQPEEVVSLAIQNGARSICFTFSEPVIFYEYMYDISSLAKAAGLHTSMVSNGYIEPEPLLQLLEVLDAVKVDLKSFTEEFFGRLVGLKPAGVSEVDVITGATVTLDAIREALLLLSFCPPSGKSYNFGTKPNNMNWHNKIGFLYGKYSVNPY